MPTVTPISIPLGRGTVRSAGGWHGQTGKHRTGTSGNSGLRTLMEKPVPGLGTGRTIAGGTGTGKSDPDISEVATDDSMIWKVPQQDPAPEDQATDPR